MSKYEKLAEALKTAERSNEPIGQISAAYPELEIRDAYRIQLINIEKELEEGRLITGKKIGLTSQAVQDMLGVNQPDFGHLLESMEAEDGVVDRSKLIQPKVEGEIVFVLEKDLVGPNVTVEDVLDATDYVAAGIEIVDSRVADWKINIIDTVADNASSGMYLVSEKRVDPKTIDLKTLSMNFYKNGQLMNSGVGAAALGDPAYCVAWLANTLHEYGVSLKKGEVILSGALTAMLEADAGDEFRASFTELGDISVKFE
ncbi:MAG: 2-keto-4-pentenoate hydratase [Tissierellia bacterium]|nr:2-keto-4-pentenoate hydratase [Tissierellia bacterium]